MGIRSRIKVRRRWVAAVLLWAAAAAAAAGTPATVGGDFPAAAPRVSKPLCAPGKQFWDPARERCRPCTVCTEPKGVVLRRCHVLTDTRCGHMRELDGRARPRHHSAPTPAPAAPAPAPVEQRPHHRPRGRWDAGEAEARAGAAAGAGGGSAERRTSAHARRLNKHGPRSNSNRTAGNHPKKSRDYVFLHHHHHHHHHEQKAPLESAAQLLGPNVPSLGAAPAAAGAEVPGGGGGAAAAGAEEHPWDWQAGVLVAAVAACALFFGAAALHGFRQLRSDARRSADADNLSATLSLIVPELGNEIPCNCTLEGYNGNQCLYIEKLLVRKSEESKEGKGNVYIDRGNSKPHE